jgi:hypothetical protein
MPLYFLPKRVPEEAERMVRERERQQASQEEEEKKKKKKGQSPAIRKTKALLTKIDEDVYLSF